MKTHLPERLKSSRRLQVEIGLAGIALWYLKKEIYPKYSGPTLGEDILPPVAESVRGGFLYSKPGDIGEDGKPKSIQIEQQHRAKYIGLSGKFDGAQNFITEHAPNSRKELLSLKRGLKRARRKMQKQIKASKRR